MIADHTALTQDAIRRHKDELSAIDRFCLFMDEFEKTGCIQGVPHTLVGISQANYVARFKRDGGEYFFDANKKPHIGEEEEIGEDMGTVGVAIFSSTTDYTGENRESVMISGSAHGRPFDDKNGIAHPI